MSKQLSVEARLGRIEQAVADLEDGDLELEQALKVYQAGLDHVRLARQQLDAYAARLEELREADDNAEDGDDADDME